jgi:hypothetical protein
VSFTVKHVRIIQITDQLTTVYTQGMSLGKGREYAHNYAREWPILPFDVSQDFIISNNIGHFDIFRILQLYFGIFRLISVDSKFAYTHFKYVKKLSNEKFLDICELDETKLLFFSLSFSIAYNVNVVKIQHLVKIDKTQFMINK